MYFTIMDNILKITRRKQYEITHAIKKNILQTFIIRCRCRHRRSYPLYVHKNIRFGKYNPEIPDCVFFPFRKHKKIAQFIQETLNCDSFEVKPAKPYPTDYDTLVNLAREEKNNHFRPELAGTIPNTGNYQTIFVGYPSWWGTMPMPLFTFFEQINCSGKTIVPFTTHEGSRFGQSLRDLQTLCPDAVLLDGFETRGSRSANAKQDVQTWLKTINIAQ